MRSTLTLAAVCGFALAASPLVAQNPGGGYLIPAGAAANVRRAVESAARSDEQRARDAGRKPADILMLAGIEDGDQVIEFGSFGH